MLPHLAEVSIPSQLRIFHTLKKVGL